MNDMIDIIKNFLHERHYKAVLPKAALLDMDGTIYDSMGHHADAWMKMCTEEGLRCSRDEFFMLEGRTGASTIDLLMQRNYGRSATDDEKKRLYRKKTEFFNELPPVGVMYGVTELLGMMKEIGMQRVIVTGSGQASLIDRLQADFPGIFSGDKMVTSRDVTHGKPHPEPYIRGLQLARVSPSQAIAVDNAPLGVESASRAGVFTVGVTTGPVPEEALYEAGATIVYPSMQAFADAFPILIYNLLNTSL